MQASIAQVTTDTPQRLITRLCKHWGHKFPVQFDDRQGQIELSIEQDEVVVKATEKSPIRRVRRITGYLSTIERFNDPKQAELNHRVTHF